VNPPEGPWPIPHGRSAFGADRHRGCPLPVPRLGMGRVRGQLTCWVRRRDLPTFRPCSPAGQHPAVLLLACGAQLRGSCFRPAWRTKPWQHPGFGAESGRHIPR